MPRKIAAPTRIPVPGGKLIEEHVGRVNTGTEALSVAHMVAPPGWVQFTVTRVALAPAPGVAVGRLAVGRPPAVAIAKFDVPIGPAVVPFSGSTLYFTSVSRLAPVSLNVVPFAATVEVSVVVDDTVTAPVVALTAWSTRWTR